MPVCEWWAESEKVRNAHLCRIQLMNVQCCSEQAKRKRERLERGSCLCAHLVHSSSIASFKARRKVKINKTKTFLVGLNTGCYRSPHVDALGTLTVRLPVYNTYVLSAIIA